MDRLLSDFLMFVATIDPMGTLAIFVGLTAGLAPAQRNRVAFRAVAYSAAILVAFIGVGQILLGSLGIRLEAFQLAGGIIFFLFGVQMVFGTGAGAAGGTPEPGRDVAVFPLAVPSIASPGAMLAAVLHTENSRYSFAEQSQTAGAMIAVLLVTLALLLLSPLINRLIGRNGASVISRVMGLILSSVAVTNVLEGIRLYFEL